MISLSKITASLVLGLAVTSALPALGASRVVPPGHNARAQAIPQDIGGEGIVSPDRALRECNASSAALPNTAGATTARTSIAPAWPSAARSSETGRGPPAGAARAMPFVPSASTRRRSRSPAASQHKPRNVTRNPEGIHR